MDNEIKRSAFDYVIVGCGSLKPNIIVIEQDDNSIGLDIDQIGTFIKHLKEVAKEITVQLNESEKE